MPSRLLSSEKIAKDESEAGEKMKLSLIDNASRPAPCLM